MVSYDMSKPLTGAKPSYHLDGTVDDNVWVVVATCANTRTIEDGTDLKIGVVKTDAYSGKLRERAQKHAFDHYIPDCARGHTR